MSSALIVAWAVFAEDKLWRLFHHEADAKNAAAYKAKDGTLLRGTVYVAPLCVAEQAKGDQ